MKKIKKIVLVVIVALFTLLILSNHMFNNATAANEKLYSNIANGLSFSTDKEVLMGTLGKQPLTIEALIRVSDTYNSKGTNKAVDAGVIFSNEGHSGSYNSLTFLIKAEGVPTLRYIDSSGVTHEYCFNGTSNKQAQLGSNYVYWNKTNNPSKKTGLVNIATSDWAHIALVINSSTKRLELYADGILVSYFENFSPITVDTSKQFYIGSSAKSGSYFKGELRSVSVYSNVRTEKEIYNDYLRKPLEDFDKNQALCAYDFTQGSNKIKTDLSGQNKTLTLNGNMASKYADTPQEGVGAIFHRDVLNTIETPLEELPLTIQAEVMIPENLTIDAGVIIGNYSELNDVSRIGAADRDLIKGSLQIIVYKTQIGIHYVEPKTGTVSEVKVNANLYTGKWINISVVIDQLNKAFKFYVDGVKVGENKTNYFNISSRVLSNKFIIGGNDYNANPSYFNGAIRNVALFSDVRTDSEIKTTYENINKNDSKLLGLWNLSSASNGYYIDKSSNSNDILIDNKWITEGLNLSSSDYDYSMVLIPDQQFFNCKWSTRLEGMYDWIVHNKTSKKIGFVMGLGDITESNEAVEWTNAVNASNKLGDAGIPYMMVRGNHDTVAQYTKYYGGNTAYTSQMNGYYSSYVNAYYIKKLGNTNYIFMTLDYGADDGVLDWASSVIKQYPDHKVIIATHAMMYYDGSFVGQGDSSNPDASVLTRNNGDELWKKFTSQHSNILMTMCGHIDSSIIYRQDKGVHGNVITQILSDYQGHDNWTDGSGYVNVLYFNEDTSEIYVESLSTVRANNGRSDYYFETKGQYTIQMPSEIVYPSSLGEYEISTDGNIAINFYANLTNAFIENEKAFLLVDDGETKTKIYASEAKYVSSGTHKGQYLFQVNIPATLMTRDIKVRLYGDDETYIGDEIATTYAKVASDMMTKSSDQKFKSLVKSLLNYGAAQQQYASVDILDLANSSLSTSDKTVNFTSVTLPTVSGKVLNDYNSTDGISIIEATLAFDSGIKLRYYLNVPADKAGNMKFKINNQEVLLKKNEKGFYVETLYISAKMLGTIYTLDVYYNSSVVLKVQYSVYHYINAVLSSSKYTSDTKLLNLLKSLYVYGENYKNYQ